MVAILASACSSQRPQRVAPLMHVTNASNTAIQSIRYEACDTPGSGYIPIDHRPLERGETVSFPLVPGCVNLKAFDVRGRIVGEQRSLRMIPGTTWRIYE